MRKIYTAFRGFFGEIHKVYYAGGEDTNIPTKNKYALWVFPVQFILFGILYYILENVVKYDKVYEFTTIASVYFTVFTITTIVYSILSKQKWSWKLYFPYPLVWFLGMSVYEEDTEKDF